MIKKFYNKKMLAALTAMLLLTAGCGKKDEDTTERTTNKITTESTESTESSDTEGTTGENTTEDASVTEDKSTATEEGTTAEPDSRTESTEGTTITPGGNLSGKDENPVTDTKSPENMAEYLSGDWNMIPGGNSSKKPPVKISFDKEENICTFYNEDGSKFIKTSMEYQSLFGDDDKANLVTLKTLEASEDTVSNSEELEHMSVDVQLLTANVNGKKYLAIREAGNGDSILGYEFLKPENRTDSFFWIFAKEEDKEQKLSDEENAFLVEKNTSFYAFKWIEENGACYLQRMDTDSFEDLWYDGTVSVSVLIYSYNNTGFGNYAVKYKCKGLKKGNPSPEFVYVTTDINGDIEKMLPAEYMGYGYYKPAEEEDSERAGLKTTDELYLGEWVDPTDPYRYLYILEDDLEVGGYKIEMFYDDQPSIFGNANADNLSLSMNQGFTYDDFWVLGHFDTAEGAIAFTVDESEYWDLPVGTVYYFERKEPLE